MQLQTTLFTKVFLLNYIILIEILSKFLRNEAYLFIMILSNIDIYMNQYGRNSDHKNPTYNSGIKYMKMKQK